MKALQLPVGLSLTLILASCSPHKVTRNPAPPVEMPEAYSSIAAEGANLPDKWWQDFGDQQLNSLVEEALHGNLQVRAAWQRMHQAKLIAKQMRAGLYPSVNHNESISQAEPVNRFFPSSPVSI